MLFHCRRLFVALQIFSAFNQLIVDIGFLHITYSVIMVYRIAELKIETIGNTYIEDQKNIPNETSKESVNILATRMTTDEDCDAVAKTCSKLEKTIDTYNEVI